MTPEQREKARARGRAYYHRHRKSILVKERAPAAVAAKAEYDRDYRAKNAESIKAKRAARDSEKVRAWKRTDYLKHREHILRKTRDWQKNNPDKVRASRRARFAANRDHILPKLAEVKRRRKAASERATPNWANKFFMQEAYDLARRRTKATGFAWHVDHIVPLLNKRVCGLHCEQNLAVITGAENFRKSNVRWPYMP